VALVSLVPKLLSLRSPAEPEINNCELEKQIAERNRTEKALQESNQFNKAIISSASEGIVVYDRELRYVLWNRFMEELKGSSPEWPW
jgi:PAS domain-containing protein